MFVSLKHIQKEKKLDADPGKYLFNPLLFGTLVHHWSYNLPMFFCVETVAKSVDIQGLL